MYSFMAAGISSHLSMLAMMIQQARITSQFSLKLAGAPWNWPEASRTVDGPLTTRL